MQAIHDVSRSHLVAAGHRNRGRWIVEVNRCGANVVEEGAGCGGEPGLVAACEIVGDAEFMAAAWNRAHGFDERACCARCGAEIDDHASENPPMPGALCADCHNDDRPEDY